MLALRPGRKRPVASLRFGMPRVVIVGAGFGGLQCARALAGTPFDVVLLDRNNYHLFTPLLYQVAGALVNPSDIAYPIRAVFRRRPNVRFRAGEVTGVDLEGRRVVLAEGPAEPWDRLVIATGAEITFFGQDRIAGVAEALTDLPKAMRLRNRVLTSFEAAAAAADPDERRRHLTFVVVGAGPTGVEYAGALSELVDLAVRRDFREIRKADVRIILAEGLDQVLPAFPEPLGRHAQVKLERKGVDVRLGVRVAEADGNRIRFDSGEEVGAGTLIWAAGVRPGALARALDVPRRDSGRLAVDEYLRLAGREDVYAIGDAAGAVEDGDELPMLAPPAMQQGRHVARTLRGELREVPPRPFHYRDKGIMATIGRNAGVAAFGPFRLTGFVGWIAWLVVHLYYIIGFRNRIAVLTRWAWEYVFYDRPIRFVIRAARRMEEET